MMEPIVWESSALAYIISGTVMPEKTQFPTPSDLEFQVGFVVYPAGGMVRPHRHAPVTRTIERTCEVILVKKGKCDVDLYNDDRQLVATRELVTGDLIILVNGGHGFRMKEDTVLLEIKQGPYFGVTEKESLE
jgi:hypothetical protein